MSFTPKFIVVGHKDGAARCQSNIRINGLSAKLSLYVIVQNNITASSEIIGDYVSAYQRYGNTQIFYTQNELIYDSVRKSFPSHLAPNFSRR